MPGNLRSDASHSLVVSKSICIRITKINLTPVSRFTPSFNASFPTLAKHKKNQFPEPGIVSSPHLLVAHSLARSLDPKKMQQSIPTTPTQKCSSKQSHLFDPPMQSHPFSKARRQTKRESRNTTQRQQRENKQASNSYRSFSTTLMTEMLKVASQATRLIIRTPPSAFCL